MSQPLIILACILAFCALVLIPLMMVKSGKSQNAERQKAHVKRHDKHHRKKKKH